MIISRDTYDLATDIAEGDLVTVDWWAGDGIEELGIVLKVAIDVRNEDHLCPSEEVLIAEVLVAGKVYVFDEDEISIVEKCNSPNV